jgi:hypothetical protein
MNRHNAPLNKSLKAFGRPRHRQDPPISHIDETRKKVEMLFAQLKPILGLGRPRLRGPCRANDDFLLAATAQNLRKMAKVFSEPQRPRKA